MTGTYSTASVAITFPWYNGTATSIADVVGCAYANAVASSVSMPDFCTAAAGPTFAYWEGASTVNIVSFQQAAVVTVALTIKNSLLSQTMAIAAAMAGTPISSLNAKVAAVNTAASIGLTSAQLTTTSLSTPYWTHAGL